MSTRTLSLVLLAFALVSLTFCLVYAVNVLGDASTVGGL